MNIIQKVKSKSLGSILGMIILFFIIERTLNTYFLVRYTDSFFLIFIVKSIIFSIGILALYHWSIPISKRCSWVCVLPILVYPFLHILIFKILSHNFNFLFQIIPMKFFETPSIFDLLSKQPMIIKVIILICGAIFEEIFYRLFILDLLGKYKIIFPSLFQAVLFGLAHFTSNVGAMLIAFLFGIMYVIVYIKWRNVYLNITVHFMLDLVAVLN